MNKFLAIFDKLIDKIPVHIQDIIQKGFIAIGALALLIAMIYGIQRGFEDAIPGGAKIHETTQDLFYTEQLREENMKNTPLIEDVELDRRDFQGTDERIDPDFTQMGRDVSDRMMGEKDEMLKKETPFESTNEIPYLDSDAESPKSLPGMQPHIPSERESLPMLEDTPEEISPLEQGGPSREVTPSNERNIPAANDDLPYMDE